MVPTLLTRRPGSAVFTWVAARQVESRTSFDPTLSRAVEPLMVDLTYGDTDGNVFDLWNKNTGNKEDDDVFQKKLVADTERFHWEFSQAAVDADPDVTTWYCSNDRGEVCPAAFTWYSPTTGEAYFDLWTRDRHVAEAALRSQVTAEVSKLDNSTERDLYFREYLSP